MDLDSLTKQLMTLQRTRLARNRVVLVNIEINDIERRILEEDTPESRALETVNKAFTEGKEEEYDVDHARSSTDVYSVRGSDDFYAVGTIFSDKFGCFVGYRTYSRLLGDQQHHATQIILPTVKDASRLLLGYLRGELLPLISKFSFKKVPKLTSLLERGGGIDTDQYFNRLPPSFREVSGAKEIVRKFKNLGWAIYETVLFNGQATHVPVTELVDGMPYMVVPITPALQIQPSSPVALLEAHALSQSGAGCTYSEGDIILAPVQFSEILFQPDSNVKLSLGSRSHTISMDQLNSGLDGGSFNSYALLK